MRLGEIDHGDCLANRLMIAFISVVSRMRLPDAARVAFYHKGFFGAPMGAWTQAAMRGPSEWSVSERELMAMAGGRLRPLQVRPEPLLFRPPPLFRSRPRIAPSCW